MCSDNNIDCNLHELLKNFKEAFELHWRNAIRELGVGQSQLTEGNRLRPQICFMGYLSTCDLSRYESIDFSKIGNIAVSIELIHKASLLLDDWIDRDTERHGVPTFHAETTPEQAVLIALRMITLSMKHLKTVFAKDIILPQHYYLCLDTLIETIYSMADGAYKELLLDTDSLLDNARVREIVQLETAEIISNSLLLGYYAGVGTNRDAQIETTFQRIGSKCGYIFQAMNDMEAFCNPQGLIEHKGSLNLDISMNRKNMLVSFLYDVASPIDKRKLKSGNVERIPALIQKYKIIEYYHLDLEEHYHSLTEEGQTLQNLGLSQEWCDLFMLFLQMVKRFAGQRL